MGNLYEVLNLEQFVERRNWRGWNWRKGFIRRNEEDLSLYLVKVRCEREEIIESVVMAGGAVCSPVRVGGDIII